MIHSKILLTSILLLLPLTSCVKSTPCSCNLETACTESKCCQQDSCKCACKTNGDESEKCTCTDCKCKNCK